MLIFLAPAPALCCAALPSLTPTPDPCACVTLHYALPGGAGGGNNGRIDSSLVPGPSQAKLGVDGGGGDLTAPMNQLVMKPPKRRGIRKA